MQIVLKELRESAYWLKLVFRTGISQSENLRLHLKETDELIKIVSKSVITAKRIK